MRTLRERAESRLRFSPEDGCTSVRFCASCDAQSAQPATEKTGVQIRGYSIDVNLDPAHHSVSAKARVEFTTSQNLATVHFQLNPALHLDSVTDGAGKNLSAKRANGEITVTPAGPLVSRSDVAWTFTYSGVADATSVGVPRLASIGEPVSYLLYRADWFPVIVMAHRFRSRDPRACSDRRSSGGQRFRRIAAYGCRWRYRLRLQLAAPGFSGNRDRWKVSTTGGGILWLTHPGLSHPTRFEFEGRYGATLRTGDCCDRRKAIWRSRIAIWPNTDR